MYLGPWLFYHWCHSNHFHTAVMESHAVAIYGAKTLQRALAIMFCVFIITLCVFVICLCWFNITLFNLFVPFCAFPNTFCGHFIS